MVYCLCTYDNFYLALLNPLHQEQTADRQAVFYLQSAARHCYLHALSWTYSPPIPVV